MVKMDGLKDLVTVLKTSNGKVALEKATEEVYGLASNEGNTNRLYTEEGLVKGLARVIKKNAKARASAIGAIENIAGGDGIEEDMFELDGLMKSLVEVVGKEGGEYKVAREHAL